MLMPENHRITEKYDLILACQRAGYKETDIEYLIDGLEDNSHANSFKNNTLIYEAARILSDFGFTNDRTEEIIRKITTKSVSYIKRIRNSKKFELKSA